MISRVVVITLLLMVLMWLEIINRTRPKGG